ncbi:MAG: hypothetical protein IJS36_02725 [Kiritimatiellae bacterium]|jgi:hypothetical protein|nr:hypothetical protein [Kiritimatiellia bacterium]
MFRRRAERATIRIDPGDPSPEFLRKCFAAVFASLDERPRRLLVDVHVKNESGAAALMSFVDGNPVFIVEERGISAADYRRRWIAEHPVPLEFRASEPTWLVMEPVDANRVKVRRARFWERPWCAARETLV